MGAGYDAGGTEIARPDYEGGPVGENRPTGEGDAVGPGDVPGVADQNVDGRDGGTTNERRVE